MNDVNRLRTEAEARHRSGEPGYAARYSDAVNRYLEAVTYRELNPMIAEVTREPTVTAAGSAKPETRRTSALVVVGVDESPASYTALDHAAIEAELRGGDLRLLHIQNTLVNRYRARDRGARLP